MQFAVLTAAGLDALEAASDQHLDTVRRAVFDALRPEQIDAMHDVMSTLVQHLDPSVASQMGIAPREE
ncbi:MAG: hypothetical protein R2715_02945 [Ilumatobacteraceae bacterium]